MSRCVTHLIETVAKNAEQSTSLDHEYWVFLTTPAQRAQVVCASRATGCNTNYRFSPTLRLFQYYYNIRFAQGEGTGFGPMDLLFFGKEDSILPIVCLGCFSSPKPLGFER